MTSSCGFLSETDERPNRDCVYASAVMMAHDAGITLPLGLTPAEREALERSDDRPDERGANLVDIETGFHRRYGVDVVAALTSPAGFLAAMEHPDATAVVQLLYASLPPHYQRWDTAFAGTGLDSRHAVNVRRRAPDGTTSPGRLWLRDPLGRPNDVWCGEWINEAALTTAAITFGAGRVSYIVMGLAAEEDVIDPTRDQPAAIADVLPGGPLVAADRVTVIDPAWPGGNGIGLYSRPVITKGYAAIRIDRIGGPAEQLEVAWVPNNRIVNVRAPGQPADVKHTVTLASDGQVIFTGEV